MCVGYSAALGGVSGIDVVVYRGVAKVTDETSVVSVGCIAVAPVGGSNYTGLKSN